MTRLLSDDALPADLGPTAVTVGKFDGVHRGHTELVRLLCEEAAARSLTPVVVTFDRNPVALFAPERAPIPLVGNERRSELLHQAGCVHVVELTFDRAFASQTPEEFVSSVLVDRLGARLVLAGSDFRYGRGGAGTVATLREAGTAHGFEVMELHDVSADDGGRISSSAIRSLLAEGAVTEAADLLGRLPSVRGTVARGHARGRSLGFPTANLAAGFEGFLPADGVYATRVAVDGGEPIPAATSIGLNPTFGDVSERVLEAHLIDRTVDLYDRAIEVFFVEYIRPMQKFADAETLAEQMAADERRIREVLGV